MDVLTETTQIFCWRKGQLVWANKQQQWHLVLLWLPSAGLQKYPRHPMKRTPVSPGNTPETDTPHPNSAGRKHLQKMGTYRNELAGGHWCTSNSLHIAVLSFNHLHSVKHKKNQPSILICTENTHFRWLLRHLHGNDTLWKCFYWPARASQDAQVVLIIKKSDFTYLNTQRLSNSSLLRHA